MSGIRRILSYFTIFVLLGSALFLWAREPVLERVSVLTEGHGLQRYEKIGVGEDGTACAARWSSSGLELIFFDLAGKERGTWTAQLPQEFQGGALTQLYPVSRDLAYLGLYSRDAETLSVYRLSREWEAECLLREACLGDSPAQRREHGQLFSFSRNKDGVYFALLSGENLSGYACGAENGGVRKLSSGQRRDVTSAAVLPNGALAAAGRGFLRIDGGADGGQVSGQQILCLTQTGTGLYYLDGASLALYYSDLTGSAIYQVMELEELIAGHTVTSLAVTAQGEVLLLLDGRELVLAGKTGSQELAVLSPTRQSSALFLGVCGVALAVLSWLIWYVLCGLLCRNRMPMVLQGSAVLIALALLLGIAGYWCVLLPQGQRDIQRKNESLVDSVVGLSIREKGIDDPALAGRLSGTLESMEGQPCRNVAVAVVNRSGDVWTDPWGGRAELLPAFDLALAQSAQERGKAGRQDGVEFTYCLMEENQALFLSLTREEPEQNRLTQLFFLALGLMTGVGIVFQLLFSRSIRTLSKAVECLSRGENPGKRLKLRTGDELEGLASTLSSLGEAMNRQSREREELAGSYRRFVPEQVLSLLGKESVREVDKKTFATRRMAVMMVRFYFPEQVYTGKGNSRLLFESVNQVIERTASIATGRGGTVFNFAFNGYDVVMEEDCQRVVGTAVAMAQEVLSLNESRTRAGLPTVTFHVALDVGDVMLGIVGDNTQMEPTTISSSFSVVSELIGLCDQLEANILCTEAMVSGVGGYGSRYMGKCWQENVPIRVYEIFSGDAYGVRRGKESSVRQFSKGVLALYSGEAAAAKRIFLDLAHSNAADGGVRYYLYLADQMEKDPDQPCGLNTLH